MVDSVKKYVSKYNILLVAFAGKGVLIKDPTVWLDGAKPPQRYICKYIKILIAQLCINDIWFGDNTIQRRKSPNSFVLEIVLQWLYYCIPYMQPLLKLKPRPILGSDLSILKPFKYILSPSSSSSG